LFARETPVAWREMFSRLPKSTLVLLAFGCVYLFWGSTYGAIHIAGEHLSAPVVSATRSLISAALIVLISVMRGKSLRVPKGEGWKLVLVGLLFMSANNMLLTWGEQMVASGFASLVVSTMPIMIALIEMVMPGGDALNKRGWAGTILGTFGIAVLVWPSLHVGKANGVAGVSSRPLLGVLVLLGAALAFAIGSVLSRRFRFTADTFVATGWQVGAAGIFNAMIAVGSGGLHRAVWTWTGFGAIVYLSIFGSLFGLVAFTYLLQHVAVTKVSTYAFVNPVIAVLLGVLFLHERLAKTEIAGMGVIVCAVAMVVYSRVDRGKREIMGMAGEAVE
jgi:drug/metabolite transporter (DMT)-like permease